MLTVGSALFLDVIAYDICGCVLPDGVDVVAACPELATPQHLLDFGVAFEELLCSNALDGLHDVLGGCCGDGLDECVHMIFVRAQFDEVDVIALLYFKTDCFECVDDTVGQNFPSVLDGENHVVQKTGFVVTLPDMSVFHATNIHRIPLPPKQSFGAIFLV